MLARDNRITIINNGGAGSSPTASKVRIYTVTQLNPFASSLLQEIWAAGGNVRQASNNSFGLIQIRTEQEIVVDAMDVRTSIGGTHMSRGEIDIEKQSSRPASPYIMKNHDYDDAHDHMPTQKIPEDGHCSL